MINSRKLDDLTPEVRGRALSFQSMCRVQGLDVLIYCTYRDREFQDFLYAQGRTRPGKVVTKAKGGESMHNYRVAFDAVPLKNGQPDWDDPHKWETMGRCGQSVGLEWGGNWKFKDMPHFQFTGGRTLKDFQAGKGA